MPASAIVVVIDRLGAGFLGPYGNTWLDTPQFNRLASQGLLCETALADSPDLALAYRAWWTGRHALEPATDSRLTLPQAAREAGLDAVLVSDDEQVAELPDAARFSKRLVLPPPQAKRAADELELTGMGTLIQAATERIRDARGPALVWIHTRGMAGPWDAPLALRQQFADEEDPTPPDFVEPPRRFLARDADPDELLGYVHAYAGQVVLADMCVGLLLDAIDQSPLADQALLAVTSPRGYPLGEHGRVGPLDGALFGELLHVPLLLRLPRGAAALTRSRRLVQPCDLAATLAQWLDLPPLPASGYAASLLPLARGEDLPPRELAVATGPAQRAVRSPAWFLHEAVVDDEIHRKLYAKPDDRFEANEVASRCGDIAEQLAAAADQWRQAAAAGTLASLPVLSEVLTDTRR